MYKEALSHKRQQRKLWNGMNPVFVHVQCIHTYNSTTQIYTTAQSLKKLRDLFNFHFKRYFVQKIRKIEISNNYI